VRVITTHLVGVVGVDALDDVDLASVGPVGADHPERRPGACGNNKDKEEILN
jgi:hypothetical protein